MKFLFSRFFKICHADFEDEGFAPDEDTPPAMAAPPPLMMLIPMPNLRLVDLLPVRDVSRARRAAPPPRGDWPRTPRRWRAATLAPGHGCASSATCCASSLAAAAGPLSA